MFRGISYGALGAVAPGVAKGHQRRRKRKGKKERKKGVNGKRIKEITWDKKKKK